jgi:hypothetical protein
MDREPQDVVKTGCLKMTDCGFNCRDSMTKLISIIELIIIKHI